MIAMTDIVSLTVAWVTAPDSIDLTSRQIALLGVVCDEPGPHGVKHLAARLNLSKPVVTRGTRVLEQLGLVTRNRGKLDKRDCFITATNAGSALRTSMARLRHGAMGSFDPNIHVPGAWHCAKCGFRLQQMHLSASNGNLTARDDAGEKCPNDGSPLWRVTLLDEYRELYDQAIPLFERYRIVGYICAEEGATVTFTGDNPDFNGLPNSVVCVAAAFTNWDDRHFRAESVLDALRLAEGAKLAFEQGVV
jgi:DNA-binding MarR family transcriptional regulator